MTRPISAGYPIVVAALLGFSLLPIGKRKRSSLKQSKMNEPWKYFRFFEIFNEREVR
jgi:hypothetical protein